MTRGDPGNDERLGFIFDRRTVRISGLAGELVVPDAAFDRIDPGALDRQFALSLDYVCGGSVDFVDVALPRRNLTHASLSWRISDHYPLWAAFSLR